VLSGVLLALGALVAAIAWLAHRPAEGFIGQWVALVGLGLYAWRRRSLTTWILVSMAVGAEIGHDWPALGQSARVLSQIFLRLIKTIIAPLLFATLVVGIAGHSNLRQVGRLGIKALLYFEVVTTIALFIGLAAINLSRAGVGVTPPPTLESPGVTAKPQTAAEAILNASNP
jgi:proton glutamate symport protein